MLHKAVLYGLVVCSGLLAKWLRVGVRVRVRAGPGNALAISRVDNMKMKI